MVAAAARSRIQCKTEFSGAVAPSSAGPKRARIPSPSTAIGPAGASSSDSDSDPKPDRDGSDWPLVFRDADPLSPGLSPQIASVGLVHPDPKFAETFSYDVWFVVWQSLAAIRFH